MPFGGKVQCFKCKKSESLMWYQVGKTIQCNNCCKSVQGPVKPVEEEGMKLTSTVQAAEKPKTPIRKNSKTARNYKTRQNPNAGPKHTAPKGKGRRSIFKKNPPVKLVPPLSSYTTTDRLEHKGQLYRTGDIVSVRDVEGGIYYAQIRGLMYDDNCEKSASIHYLVPTIDEAPYPVEGFNPMTYVLGETDDLPRRLDCMQYVTHIPSDYYKVQTPFPSGIPDPFDSGYIWGRVRFR